MREESNKHLYPSALPLLPSFLHILKREGFIYGIGTYIQFFELLKGLAPETTAEHLSSILCPLFAKNVDQQERFYELYSEHVLRRIHDSAELTLSDTGKHGVPENNIPERTSKKTYLLYLAIVTLVLAVAVGYLYVSFERNIAADPIEEYQEIQLPTTKKPSTKEHVIAIPKINIQQKESYQPGNTAEDNTNTPESFFVFLEFLKSNEWALKGILSVFLLIGLLLHELYRAKERRKFRLRKRNLSKPHFWEIDTNNSTDISIEADLQATINSLRERYLSEEVHFSIPATIHQTIQNAGAVSIRYKRRKSAKEFLFLIDSSNSKNHQFRLFNFLCDSFEERNVQLERFFFSGTPQVCWNEQNPRGLGIRQLAERFSSYQLVILGDGEQFINAVTGSLKSWTKDFSFWTTKVIVSPKATATWSFEEFELATVFKLIPASLRGLSFLVPKPSAEANITLRDWKFDPDHRVEPIVTESSDVIKSLSSSFSYRVITWIACCAIYPELNWDLTLHIGETLSERGENLVNIRNLIDLSRLDWFVTGNIPNPVRQQLIRHLPATTAQEIRAEIIEVLEKNPPPNSSTAFDEYRMNIVTQKMLLAKDADEAFVREYKALAEAGLKSDFTVLEYLDDQKDLIDFTFQSKKINQLIYYKGHPFFGRKPWIHWVALALFLLGLFAFNPLSLAPKEAVFENGHFTVLSSYQDSLNYFIDKSKNRLDNNSYIDSLAQVFVDSAFYRFLGIEYFNQGAIFFAGYNNDSLRRSQHYFKNAFYYQGLSTKDEASDLDYAHALGITNLYASNFELAQEWNRYITVLDSNYYQERSPNLNQLIDFNFTEFSDFDQVNITIEEYPVTDSIRTEDTADSAPVPENRPTAIDTALLTFDPPRRRPTNGIDSLATSQNTVDSSLMDIDNPFNLFETINAQAGDSTNTAAIEPQNSQIPNSIEARLNALDLPFSFELTSIIRVDIRRHIVEGYRDSEYILGRSVMYFPIFEFYLAKYDLPEALKYVSVVESSLRPNVHSPVGEVGLWQFVPTTARLLGLEVNGQVDERLDPILSTEAASRMFSSLYKQFGDWLLVLAAYNCGPGRVRRAIQSAGSSDFYSINPYLPKETQLFIPRFIAAAYLFNFYDSHGIKPNLPNSDLVETTTFNVRNSIHISTIASEFDISYRTLNNLNPAFLQGLIPPTSDGYKFTVPDRIAPGIRDYLLDRSDSYDISSMPLGQQQTFYRVVPGDDIEILARLFQVSVNDIMEWNDLNSEELWPNQELIIYLP